MRKKTIIPTDVQRRHGNVINQTAQQIDPAGRHRIDVNANAKGNVTTKQPGRLPSDPASRNPPIDPSSKDGPTSKDDAARERDDANKNRLADPEEMKDPPREWSEVDEQIDDSFPASDPPANY